MDEIRRRARERALQMKLPYAGAVTPAEAHALMKAGAALVDVRTTAERHFVGSVPGIWLGAQLTRKMPERLVRTLLCLSLVTAGLKVIH